MAMFEYILTIYFTLGGESAVAVIPIFVSSTFRDFHAERDELVATVLPALNDQVAQHGCVVELIDLRWGVAAAEGDAQQARVLEVCLEEIERARPLFVGLLGDRYGWVPDRIRLANAVREAGMSDCQQGISATALEFEYGALRRPPREAVFFERVVVGSIPPDWRDDDVTRIDALKAQVRQRCEVHTYRVTCRDARPTDLSEFVECAIRVLGAKVAERAREIAGHAPDPVAAAETLFFEDRSRAFGGRSHLVTRCRDTIVGRSSVCLTGESGVGKSAIWCAVVNELIAQDVRVVAVPVGASPEVSSLRGFLLRICQGLGADPPTSLSIEQLHDYAREVLGAAAPVVLAVDGLDQLPGQPRPTFLSGLPAGVTVLVSTAAHEQVRYAVAAGMTALEVTALDADDGRAAVNAICASMSRTLPSAAVDRLTAEARAPLWLRLAVGELSALAAEDFGSVDLQADPLAEIARLVTQTVYRLPSSTGQLLAGIVDRAVRRFGDREVGATLSLAAVSRSGLRPIDFERLTGLDALTIAGIRRALSSLLVTRGEGGRLGFTHGVVRDYVTARFVSDEAATDLHRLLAEHFQADEDDDPLCQEDRLWHLLRSRGLSAAAVLNRVTSDRQAGLAGVVLESLSAPGVGETLWGLDRNGIQFLTATVLTYKSTMRARERIMLCANVFAEARQLAEAGDSVSEDTLRAVAVAASCLADLPNVHGIDLSAAAHEASEFTGGLVARYPDSQAAHEANAQTATFLAREADEEQTLAASRIAVREWQWVAARSPSLHVNSWLQFALVQCAGMELRSGDAAVARSHYEQALPLTYELLEFRGGETAAKINVVNVLSGLGHVAAAEGNAADELRYLGEAVAMTQSAYVEDPDRSATENLAQLARMYGMALANSAHLDAARQWLDYSDRIFREFAKIDPENSQWIFGLDATARAAALDIAHGDVDGARRRIRNAIDDAPDSELALSVFIQSMVRVARERLRAGEHSTAVGVAAEVIGLSADPDVDFPSYQRDTLAEVFEIHSDASYAEGAVDRAKASMREAIAIRRALLDEQDEQEEHDGSLARLTGFSLLALATMSEGAQRVSVVKEVAQHWTRYLAEDEGEGGASNQWLARRLSAMAFSAGSDTGTLLQAALRYAKSLVDSDPANGDYLADWIGVLEASGLAVANTGDLVRGAKTLMTAAEQVSTVDPKHPRLMQAAQSIARNLRRVADRPGFDPNLAANCLYQADQLSPE